VELSSGSYGKAIKVIARKLLQKIAARPFPNITAPMYLKGRLAAIVKMEPCAMPEKAPNGKHTVKQIQ